LTFGVVLTSKKDIKIAPDFINAPKTGGRTREVCLRGMKKCFEGRGKSCAGPS